MPLIHTTVASSSTDPAKQLKLTVALVACDTNPFYLSFWPIVRRAWNHIVGVRCILVLVADNVPEDLSFHEDIRLWKPVPGMHTAFQAQCIRMLYPALLSVDVVDSNGVRGFCKENDGILISDMDMIPMSREYYQRAASYATNQRQLVSFREDGPRHWRQIFMCYNMATASTWSDIFDVRNATDVANRLRQWYPSDYTGTPAGAGWITDQCRFYDAVMAWPEKSTRFLQLTDEQLQFRRLDRLNNPNVDETRVQMRSLQPYTDFHMIRPYETYRELLENVYEVALKAACGSLSMSAHN